MYTMQILDVISVGGLLYILISICCFTLCISLLIISFLGLSRFVFMVFR